MDFDENEQDRSFIKIYNIWFDNNEHTFEVITYELSTIKEIMGRLNDINHNLLLVWNELLKDYKRKNPNSSNSAI
jgi:hypothetical protein